MALTPYAPAATISGMRIVAGMAGFMLSLLLKGRQVMKHTLLTLFVSVLLCSAGGATAGSDDPTVTGYWEGDGRAMYVDGTQAAIIFISAVLFQDDDFFHGFAHFEVLIGDSTEPVSQEGQMSGHLKGNAVKGLMGGCFTVAPDCIGAAVLDGKLAGNKLSGTVVDFSDGSTAALTLHRIAE
jgi:hypothetical protein